MSCNKLNNNIILCIYILYNITYFINSLSIAIAKYHRHPAWTAVQGANPPRRTAARRS